MGASKKFEQGDQLGEVHGGLAPLGYRTNPYPEDPTGPKEILDRSDLKKVIDFEAKGRLMQDAQTICIAMALTSIRISDLDRLFDNIALRSGVYCSQFKCSKHPNPEVAPIIFSPVQKLIQRNGMPKKRHENITREAVQSLIKLSGVNKHVELHSLRRSFVSNFLSLGVVPDYSIGPCFHGPFAQRGR